MAEDDADWAHLFPANWHRTRLKYLIASVESGTWGEEPYEESDPVCVRAADFDRVRLRVGDAKLVRRHVPKDLARYLLRKNDLILEKSGGGEEAPVGLAVRFDLDQPAVCSNFTARLRPSDRVEARYLSYVLAGVYFMGLNERSIHQTTGLQNLDLAAFLNEEWAVPDLQTQRRIVDQLDAETHRIDELVEAKRQLRDVLAERRSAVISAAFTGGEGVHAVPLKWLARPGKTSFTDGDWIESPYITSAGIRLIQTGNVGVGAYREQSPKYITEETFRAFDCTEVVPGDVLISRLSPPVGRACVAPDLGVRMITSVDVCIFRPRGDLDPSYLVYYLSSDRHLQFVAAICRGTTMDRISRTMLGNLTVPLRPLEEQRRIVARLEAETRRIDALLALIDAQLPKLAEYRRALVSETVTARSPAHLHGVPLPTAPPPSVVAEQPRSQTVGAS